MSDIKEETWKPSDSLVQIASAIPGSSPPKKGRPKLTQEQKVLSDARRKEYLHEYYKANEEKIRARYVPSDYSRAVIYRVFSPETDRFYIGSTARPLENRMAEHRRCILRRSNALYETMADLSLIWQIEPLMVCDAESREYLEQLELLYIAQGSVDGKVLNTNKRYTTEALKALQQVMSIMKTMKKEHLPAIFKVA